MSNRRTFIKNVGLTSTAVCCGVGLSNVFVSCSSVKYVSGTHGIESISVLKSDFEENKFIVVNGEKLSTPIYLSKVDDGYLAFSMLCTHLGCELKPTGTFMTCPCHGSEFSNKGEVLNGPAYENLAAYEVLVTAEEIKIDLREK
jgi:cytochrome b6-f complex iron-sulfur subunit